MCATLFTLQGLACWVASLLPVRLGTAALFLAVGALFPVSALRDTELTVPGPWSVPSFALLAALVGGWGAITFVLLTGAWGGRAGGHLDIGRRLRRSLPRSTYRRWPAPVRATLLRLLRRPWLPDAVRTALAVAFEAVAQVGPGRFLLTIAALGLSTAWAGGSPALAIALAGLAYQLVPRPAFTTLAPFHVRAEGGRLFCALGLSAVLAAFCYGIGFVIATFVGTAFGYHPPPVIAGPMLLAAMLAAAFTFRVWAVDNDESVRFLHVASLLGLLATAVWSSAVALWTTTAIVALTWALSLAGWVLRQLARDVDPRRGYAQLAGGTSLVAIGVVAGWLLWPSIVGAFDTGDIAYRNGRLHYGTYEVSHERATTISGGADPERSTGQVLPGVPGWQWRYAQNPAHPQAAMTVTLGTVGIGPTACDRVDRYMAKLRDQDQVLWSSSSLDEAAGPFTRPECRAVLALESDKQDEPFRLVMLVGYRRLGAERLVRVDASGERPESLVPLLQTSRIDARPLTDGLFYFGKESPSVEAEPEGVAPSLPPHPSFVSVHRYESGGERLAAFLHQPDGEWERPAPGLLWIHDGFGDLGDDCWNGKAGRRAAKGVVVLCHALPGENGNPGPLPVLDDRAVESAEDALRSLASLPGVDPERLQVAGEGTGASLALLLGASEPRPEASQVIAFRPVLSLHQRPVLGTGAGEAPHDFLTAASRSPIYRLHDVDTALIQPLPGDRKIYGGMFKLHPHMNVINGLW
jgi:acetyl esterase/lipase